MRTLLLVACLSATASAADYAETVRSTNGLLAYYRCQNDGDSLADASDQKAAAKVVGATERNVDSAWPKLGKAIRLTKGAHLRLPTLGKHDAASVELWIRLNKQPAEGIAGLYAADNWQSGFFHLNLRTGGVIELAINGTGNFPLSEAEVTPLEKWTHLVATYDREAAELKLYRDGRLVLETNPSGGPAMDFVAGSIGAWITGNVTRPLEADLDEIAFYSTALTAGQVRQHYSLAKGVSATPVDFARDVRPVLERRCFGCHGEKKRDSELRLDIRDWALRGGESGEPTITPYASEDSHLVKLITNPDANARMPLDEEPLTEAEIAKIRNWIDQGALWPDELAGQMEVEKVATKHWSFQPIVKYEPPAGDEPFVKTGNAIDGFILAKLAEKQLTPSPRADARTLIRRLYFDMHGLPPTPEETAAFLKDESPQAWADLVDRVLASPRYGERWASHWLDVIRYGDTHGFEVNTPRDNAWPYRDYVIKSLNDDKPYDRFLMEQIAGEQLGADAATGFLVAAPAVMPGQVGKDLASQRQARADELHEIIVSIGSGVLGLTVGCARCHNHKFDPISQRDYYQLQAIVAGVRYEDRPIRIGVPPSGGEANSKPPKGGIPTVVFGGTFSSSPAVHRLYRGDPMQRRERMSPDVPAVFGTLGLSVITPEPQRRLALAKWLVDPANPLPARVIVNRLWQHHFGTGLVATPSDFGGMGFKPTHPELLDYLAARLVEEGWSLKKLHRSILLSNTYQQSSRPTPEGLAADAETKLLWRYPPRRLEMEPIRDSILAVSGALDLTMGGPGFMVFKPNSNYVRVYDPKEEWGPGEWRRMVYAHRVRMAQDGVFGAFDCPDAGQPQPKRSRSTTAIQALNLLNSSFMKQQSDLLADRLRRDAGDDPAKQVARLFQLAYNRAPTTSELAEANEVAKDVGLAAVCRAVLNSNEFLFVP